MRCLGNREGIGE
jgi:hypothetical protein